MKVVAFLPHYNEKHAAILKALAEGIPGAETRDVRDYEPCDVAIVFGLVKKSFRPTWSKAEILERHSGRSLIVVESAPVNRGNYWAVGWGGIGGGADFNNRNMPLDRWEKIGVSTKKWRKKPEGPVVVCGQLPRDTNVQDTDHPAWCREAVEYYDTRGYDVLFRPHPRIDDPEVYGVPERFWDREKLKVTLSGARCFVTYNSTTGTDAALRGVPVIACDRWSFAWPVSSHEFMHPDNIRCPSRTEWLASLGYAQWDMDEMRSGETWAHLNRA